MEVVITKNAIQKAIILVRNENEKDNSHVQARVNNVLLSEAKKQYKADIYKAIKGQICTAVQYCI